VKHYYTDTTVSLYHGANLDVLPHLADGSVDCVVTSPPFFGLRDYGVAGQYGAEKTPAEFVANLVATFREVRRVLADDGVIFVNLGDSYNSKASNQNAPNANRDGSRDRKQRALESATGRQTKSPDGGLPAKNLLGIPWRTAFALQDDGWILRNAVVWRKTNPMPEPVKDRMSGVYEMLFLLSKSRKYWFSLDEVREPHTTALPVVRKDLSRNRIVSTAPGSEATDAWGALGYTEGGKNPGDVWDIPTVPFPGAHFATYPPELVRRCIVSGCKPGGTVLDPFHGSGTTGMVAVRNGRKYVGIELNQEYLDLSLRTRLADGVLDFEGEAS
jgi:site-specific DNA-methyltransferase (cytosine-N4-specific)